MNNTTKQQVLDLLTDWTNIKRIFTAFDVTSHLRSVGIHVRHSEIRDEVHDFFRNGWAIDYGRDNRVFGNDSPAWVYYPLGGSPDDHPGLKKTGSSTITSLDLLGIATIDILEPTEPVTVHHIPQVNRVPQVNRNGDVSNSKSKWKLGDPRSIDPNGRLRIPGIVLDKANMLGKKIIIIPTGNRNEVELRQVGGNSKAASELQTYAFDKDNSIRFCPRKYGMVGSEFIIESNIDQKKIRVSVKHSAV